MAGTEVAVKLARAWVRGLVEMASVVQTTLEDYLDAQDYARKAVVEERLGKMPANREVKCPGCGAKCVTSSDVGNCHTCGAAFSGKFSNPAPLFGPGKPDLRVVDPVAQGIVKLEGHSWQFEMTNDNVFLLLAREKDHPHSLVQLTREQAADIVRLIGGAELAAKSGL